MEIHIIKKETVILKNGKEDDFIDLGKFELMDGGPAKSLSIKLDEEVPIRVYLAPFPVSPTMINVNNRFSVQYYMNLTLFDTDDKRYFKQPEIILYRAY